MVGQLPLLDRLFRLRLGLCSPLQGCGNLSLQQVPGKCIRGLTWDICVHSDREPNKASMMSRLRTIITSNRYKTITRYYGVPATPSLSPKSTLGQRPGWFGALFIDICTAVGLATHPLWA